MINLVKDGEYSLLETRDLKKILILDNKSFACINAEDIGEILVWSKRKFVDDSVLAKGFYRIYSVKNEPKFTDLTHLELFVGRKTWQGYLLPTGFPTNGKKRSRIIPTNETISK
ncbi:hypothetical protein M1615_02340 [Patescibacteria group bacterium]|nr:hypothetical protein [Patescibacteria group bacterium]